MGELDFPESVVPSIAAYYHVPSVWCENAPTNEEWESASESKLIRNVYENTINNCIRVRVRRDGLFIFDFSNGPFGSKTEIPGYQLKSGRQIPQKVTEAKRHAEKKAFYRIHILNVHQACIGFSHSIVHRRATPLSQLITPTRLISLARFQDDHSGSFYLSNDPFQRYLVAQTTLDPSFRIQHPEIRRRQLLELGTISYSFELLEEIINHELPDLPQLVEMLYRAALEYSDSHFAECLVLGWTICERLLNHLWKQYLSERKLQDDNTVRINSERNKKLTGKDFTSSIILENLELVNYLSTDLYSKIDKLRIARNKRLHDLVSISDREAASSVRIAEELLGLVSNIKMSLCLSRTQPGSSPIPISLFQESD